MIKAILHVEDLSVNVLSYEFDFKKTTDAQWRPYPGTLFQGLVVKVEGSENNIWWEHAIADHMPIAKITLELQPAILGQHKTTYHHFYDCHISSFKSRFSSRSKQPFYEMFLITCQGFESSTSSAVYQTMFRKTFDNTATSVVRETTEGRFINAFFEDSSGNALTQLNSGLTVHLILETEEMSSKLIAVDLKGYKVHFQYQGKTLENDILEDLKILNNRQVVVLQTLKKE